MMKKIALMLGCTMMLSGISFAYGPRQLCHNYPDFAIEGPNHKDFVLLINDYPGLTKSLYKISADMYYGPQTLAQLSMNYDMCHAM